MKIYLGFKYDQIPQKLAQHEEKLDIKICINFSIICAGQISKSAYLTTLNLTLENGKLIMFEFKILLLLE